jgi:hypothetical protein
MSQKCDILLVQYKERERINVFQKGDRVKIIEIGNLKKEFLFSGEVLKIGDKGTVEYIKGRKTFFFPDKTPNNLCNLFTEKLVKDNTKVVNGTRLRLKKYAYGIPGGELATATDNVESVDITQPIPILVNFDKPEYSRSGYRLFNANRFEIVENEGEKNMAEIEVIHHVMKMQDIGGKFDKLGDFTLLPSAVEEYLWRNYGAGVYIVKIKNADIGRIFKLQAPTEVKAYESVPVEL